MQYLHLPGFSLKNKNFLESPGRNILIIETPRDDHQYPFYDRIYKLIS